MPAATVSPPSQPLPEVTSLSNFVRRSKMQLQENATAYVALEMQKGYYDSIAEVLKTLKEVTTKLDALMPTDQFGR